MSVVGEGKYKWTPESTQLLVSVWTDKQVQKQLEYATKPQLIWESIAKYMNKKGYNVNGKQCRSRMKQVLVCYREAKRSGTKAGVEQYYESIDRVLKFKKQEQINSNGIDTVDSVVNIKSPPKDVKTNKNIQMRYKYQQPPDSIYRTEALTPVWNGGRDNDYPESPESNETVLAQPYRVFSPVRDAATNTTQQQLSITNKKILHHNGLYEEPPIKETYRQSTYTNKFYDVPFQNTVQNVQNQIIQENMQQNQTLLQQNLLQNQILEHNRLQINPILRQNLQNINQGLYNDQGVLCNQAPLGCNHNIIAENVLQNLQSKCQLNSVGNRAMPQEPRKNSFRQNLLANYRQFQEPISQNYNANMNHLGFVSPSISPDIPPNLNYGFCQTKLDKANGIHDAYSRPSSNPLNDVTTITNNATFNDDSLSIEFLQNSPTPDSEPTKPKDFAVNTDDIPNAPFRKKKAEKLERLMMSAINSQNEVVNKILAAQNEMVTRVLDIDRDRQNRLENRLDHLLDVVQTAVLNKSSERVNDTPSPPSEAVITNLQPPPKPGIVPPKLDLVPPKPCRVPCTSSNTNKPPVNQNQNPVKTRPGVVSPIINSPSKKVGAIWQKLGPVSTSPFVRAQQQLGFRPISMNDEIRTKSSAERRIAKEFEIGMDTKTLIFETQNLLEAERLIQEETENARIKSQMGQELQARRRLFTQREPSAAQILTAAFLDNEIECTEADENARLEWIRQKQRISEREYCNRPLEQYKYDHNVKRNENVITGQEDTYERLRYLDIREKPIGNPCNSSTPSKVPAPPPPPPKPGYINKEPRQTIQQLAQLVMNSERWKNATTENQRKDLNFRLANGNLQKSSTVNNDIVILCKEEQNKNHMQFENQMDGKAKTLNWLQERYSYDEQPNRNNYEVHNRLAANNGPQKPARHTVGFTTGFVENESNNQQRRQTVGDLEKRVGFVYDNFFDGNKKSYFNNDEKDPFEELHQLYLQKQMKLAHNQEMPFMVHNGQVVLAQNDMIERYVQDLNPRNRRNKDSDSDNDDEFLDTTATMPSSRKNSVTSGGSKNGKFETGCVIS
ncbi:uncharacterized protein LOC131664464 [Phymastichus coffea]|uniref:uncharacterized protein LOC131664464 n=1 Tax=Phymastichus coffea TaxID=108790 RepID=UPI00273C932B|nr:uncharacterized protein LOC131664464 [Phymastichus coffea]XP_058791565.1 uncharacterized protein LOC131664464 [Phymastichus coffea]XP_058791566.1 uncharacterized protein LOC131664464 [Phymastichus coffea]XP_058791567.1 uncharacterized protein LOC131664464 [Phymastichus coffea]XP_058791568.1 uncharacterized protein LOC131664464 [Phymastichus coffea]